MLAKLLNLLHELYPRLPSFCDTVHAFLWFVNPTREQAQIALTLHFWQSEGVLENRQISKCA